MIQLIVSDLDGTLLNSQRQLPSRFSALLRELYCRDITFAIASGRSRIAIESLFGDKMQELYLLCDNGACILQPNRAPVIHALSQEMAQHVLDLCRRLPHTTPMLCGYDHAYYPDSISEEVSNEIHHYYQNGVALPYEELYHLPEPILKIALCDMKTLEIQTYPIVRQTFRDALEIVISGDYWIDLMQKDVTKGSAVAGLQESLGWTAAETMVFGDCDNDIPMFSCAAYSYAMRNASLRVQQAANFVAPSNDEDGVIQVICQQLGLRLS